MSKVIKGVEGAMRGYRPQVDWGGEEGSATIMVGGHNVKLATSGWRRRCLFILLVALLFIAIINLVLTLWLLRKISFNTEGAGSLHVVVGGVNLDGIARLDHELTVSEIQGRPDKNLEIIGYHNISGALLNPDGTHTSDFKLDTSGLSVSTKGLRLKNEKGEMLFEARLNGTKVGAKFFTVTGDGGAIFNGALQTERLLGDDVHEFRVESKTRSLYGSAANLLRIEARDGDVTASSLNDATLTSKQGKFRFESPNVFMPNLLIVEDVVTSALSTVSPQIDTQIPRPFTQTPTPMDENVEANEDQERIEVFQVCVCPNGKLFLSAADSVCNPDELTCK